MSTNRITAKDVRGVFIRAQKAASRVGIDTTNWALYEGNAASNWRLFSVDPVSGGRSPAGLALGDHLGTNAREAYDRLMSYAWAWESVEAAAIA